MILQLMAFVAAALILYHHLVYPLILRRRLNRLPAGVKVERRSANDNTLPEVTLLIPAYNEAAYIGAKIANLGFIDYPADKLKIIIACDGCQDNTAALAREAAAQVENQHLHLTVLDYPQNRGKVAIINELVPTISSPWVAMSDVSALISIDGLRVAARSMSEPDVGVICSHYQLLNPGSDGEASYWQYQSRIKACEGQMGATIGVHGACYLFRTDLFKALPDDTINDDFVLPMSLVAQGYRSVYASDLHALELESSPINMDLRRRRRIAAGNAQQAWRLKGLALPKYRSVAFNFFSGKLLRVVMPYLMLALLVSTGVLALDSSFWTGVFISQLVVYAMGITAYFDGQRGLPEPIVHRSNDFSRRLAKARRLLNRGAALVSYLVLGHMANLVGSVRYLLRLDSGRWVRVSDSALMPTAALAHQVKER
jgi:cellulose synthase/poly-beta-1,6-N-acetylglucosamine synthase-like glycosyltransferase